MRTHLLKGLLLAGSIKERPSTSGFHRGPKLVLSAYYITNDACRFLLLHIGEVCVVLTVMVGGGVLVGVFAYFGLFFFFFFRTRTQSFPYTIQKSPTTRIKRQVNNLTVGPASGAPLHQAVGEKGVCAFPKSNAEIRQTAPRRPLVPALFTQGSLLSSRLQQRGAGWPFLCWDPWSGACSLSPLKGHQPTKLLQN